MTSKLALIYGKNGRNMEEFKYIPKLGKMEISTLVGKQCWILGPPKNPWWWLWWLLSYLHNDWWWPQTLFLPFLKDKVKMTQKNSKNHLKGPWPSWWDDVFHCGAIFWKKNANFFKTIAGLEKSWKLGHWQFFGNFFHDAQYNNLWR